MRLSSKAANKKGITSDDNNPTTKLTGEAYLNNRRDYWRKERAKNPALPLKTTKEEEKPKKDTDWANIIGIIVGVIIMVAVFAFIASGGEEVLNWFIAILVILALLKKG